MSEADEGPQMPAGKGYPMRGDGEVRLAIPREALWDLVMDPERLAAAIPGAETLRLETEEPRTYAADVGIGVGRLKGTYRVEAELTEMVPPQSIVLLGGAKGPFGNSTGEGWVTFDETAEGTAVRYTYAILIKGMVASLGGRLLDAAADTLIEKFFTRLARAVEREKAS